MLIDIESYYRPDLAASAVGHLEAAVDLAPSPRYLRMLGAAYLAARRYEDALSCLESVADRPPDADLAYLMAFCQWRLGNLDAADGILDQVFDRNPRERVRFPSMRGRILFDRGRFAEARASFELAFENGSGRRGLRFEFARALVAEAETQESAEHLYRRAQSLLLDDAPPTELADAWRGLLGRISLGLGCPYEARGHFKQISSYGSASEAKVIEGIVALMERRKVDAVMALRTAAQSGEGRPRIEQFLSEIATAPRMPTAGTHRSPRDIAVSIKFLSAIFGAGAPEIERIQKASVNAVFAVSPPLKADDSSPEPSADGAFDRRPEKARLTTQEAHALAAPVATRRVATLSARQRNDRGATPKTDVARFVGSTPQCGPGLRGSELAPARDGARKGRPDLSALCADVTDTVEEQIEA